MWISKLRIPNENGFMMWKNFKPRHYFCSWDKDEPKGVMQIDNSLSDLMVRREGVPMMNETVLRLAHAEYRKQCGSQQDYERMQERGGLSVLEVVRLLADYVERLGGTPTEPRS